MDIKIGDRIGHKFPSWVNCKEWEYLETLVVVGFRYDDRLGDLVQVESEDDGCSYCICLGLFNDDTFYTKIN